MRKTATGGARTGMKQVGMKQGGAKKPEAGRPFPTAAPPFQPKKKGK